jgi:cysteine synthase A
MILAAERSGELSRGSGQTILEPTGGNTGLGIAMAASVLGYRVVLVIPDNYSREKQRLLRAFGCEIVLSDSRRGNNSHGELAQEILLEHPEYVLLNQGANPANPRAHQESTVIEILADLGDVRVRHLVAGVGTGGHITGVGSVLKKALGDLTVHAVQPDGCDLLDQRFVRHKIQGLAIGYLPQVLDTSVIDTVETVTAEDAATGMRLLMSQEGIAAGISTGANIAACLKVAALAPGETILTFAYDSAHDYLELL